MFKKKITAIAISIFITSAHAYLPATPLNGDARIVEFEYNPDQIYPVLTRPFAVTNIELPKGDPVKTLMAGDTSNFIINLNKARNEIFIKPKYEGLETTLTVITENKKYQYVIRSTGKGRKYYQQVSFAKPAADFFEFDDLHKQDVDKAIKQEPVDVESSSSKVDFGNLYSTYQIKGEASFKPLAVYDNGVMMWIKFAHRLNELPAIFGKSDDSLYLVNYVVEKNNVVVIQQLAKEIVLKIDSEEVLIKRGKPTLFGWSE